MCFHTKFIKSLYKVFQSFWNWLFSKRETYFWTLSFLLLFVGLSPSRIIEKSYIISDDHLMKYWSICLDRVLSDSFFILLFSFLKFSNRVLVTINVCSDLFFFVCVLSSALIDGKSCRLSKWALFFHLIVCWKICGFWNLFVSLPHLVDY